MRARQLRAGPGPRPVTRPLADHGAPSAPVVVIPPSVGTTYTIAVSDPASSFTTTLDHAVNDQTSPFLEENNGPGSFSFTMGLYDSQAALCDPSLGREFRLYRQGVLIGAGPILTDDVDPAAKTVTFGCANLLGYFPGRMIDRGAGRVNLLTNPQFESDVVGARPATGWTEVGITSMVDNSQRILGAKALKLTQANPSENTYVKQGVSIAGGGIGNLITVAAWFYVDGATWVGPALEGWGLIVRQTDGGSTVYDFRGDESRIDSDTNRGQWLRVETTTWVPPNVTRTVEVRLYGPGGTIWWDGLSMTQMESLSFLRADQSAIAEGVVLFLQSRYFGFTDADKSDLHIATSCPATGVVRDRTWQFADHTSGDVALSEFPGLDNGFDYGIGADRVFRTYYPRRGTDRSASITLTSTDSADNARSFNCILLNRKFDIHQGASQVIQLGPGDGPDREEGGASDDTAFGGVTWQKVMAPRGNPPIDTLQARASQELAVAKTPVLYQVQITDPTLIATLALGDSVGSSFSHGYVSETRKLRIVTASRDPRTDTMAVGLNVA